MNNFLIHPKYLAFILILILTTSYAGGLGLAFDYPSDMKLNAGQHASFGVRVTNRHEGTVILTPKIIDNYGETVIVSATTSPGGPVNINNQSQAYILVKDQKISFDHRITVPEDAQIGDTDRITFTYDVQPYSNNTEGGMQVSTVSGGMVTLNYEVVPPSCGNGICQPDKNENCLICLQDCGCEKGSKCQPSNAKSNLNGCILPEPECGDGECNGNETQEICPEDCGEPEIVPEIEPEGETDYTMYIMGALVVIIALLVYNNINKGNVKTIEYPRPKATRKKATKKTAKKTKKKR